VLVRLFAFARQPHANESARVARESIRYDFEISPRFPVHIEVFVHFLGDGVVPNAVLKLRNVFKRGSKQRYACNCEDHAS
jgi:hypothetical protein